MQRQPFGGAARQHQFPPTGRGVTNCQPVNNVCICKRPKCILLCRLCGYKMLGRVRTSCTKHPMTIYLMDIEICPGCRAQSDMIKEYSLEDVHE